MELQRFEQAILKLAFETNARITTASVAYYLGIPSREASRMLNELLEEGVLELDSDAAGNLYYRVPNKPSDVAIGLFSDESFDGTDATQKTPPPLPAPASRKDEREAQQPRVSPNFLTSIDDSSDTPAPTATTAHSPAFEHVRSPEAPATAMRQGVFGKRWGDARGQSPSRTAAPLGTVGYGGHPDGEDGTAGTRAMTARKPAWTTVSTLSASPDASLDRCGASSLVVSSRVRCEPRPLPSPKPMIVSCSEPTTSLDVHQQNWFGAPAPSTSTALVPAKDTALARDYYIEQPEHQPGMALLLSLILCGTGQIYNGEVSKGIMMMVLCFLLWFVLLGWVVHIWSIVDAVVVAERLNRRQA